MVGGGYHYPVLLQRKLLLPNQALPVRSWGLDCYCDKEMGLELVRKVLNCSTSDGGSVNSLLVVAAIAPKMRTCSHDAPHGRGGVHGRGAPARCAGKRCACVIERFATVVQC